MSSNQLWSWRTSKGCACASRHSGNGYQAARLPILVRRFGAAVAQAVRSFLPSLWLTQDVRF